MARLLIVEDDADVSEALAEALRAMGHEVETASNGEVGLSMLAKACVDAVLVDLEMPILDGPGMVVRMVVQNCGLEKIPVVLVSGMADVAAVAERLGTPYHLLKPYGLGDLFRVLGRALSERKAPGRRRPPEVIQ
jgi:DNA-binding NtrC family response regulator